MNYPDEEIVELKRIKRNQKYSDIKNVGIYVEDNFIQFSPRTITEKLEIYLPEEFILMPEEFQVLKYPSVNRPHIIFTSLDGSVNFAFNLIDDAISDGEIEILSVQMKELLKKSNPMITFEQEEKSMTSMGNIICMFAYSSFGIDEKLYNISCFTQLNKGILHGIFNCPQQVAKEWRGAAWQVFQSLGESQNTIR